MYLYAFYVIIFTKMNTREEVFSLYNKLNILLEREYEFLKKADIDGAFSILEEENKIISLIESFPKKKYVLTDKDRENFSRIINICMEKRKRNEAFVKKLKDTLKNDILEMEKNKEAIKSYFNEKIVAPKFIDKRR